MLSERRQARNAYSTSSFIFRSSFRSEYVPLPKELWIESLARSYKRNMKGVPLGGKFRVAKNETNCRKENPDEGQVCSNGRG